MPVPYDPTKPWKVLSKHGRACLSSVLLSVDYWAMLLIHVMICLAFWYCEAQLKLAQMTNAKAKDVPKNTFCNMGFSFRWPQSTNQSPVKIKVESFHFWQELPIVNAYLTTLLVFASVSFLNHAMAKYNAFTAGAGKCTGTLHDAAQAALAFLGHDPLLQRDFMRLLHAVHHMGYYWYGGHLKDPYFWQMMLDRRLLSQGEIKWLMAKGDNHCQIVSAWAIQLIRTEVEQKRVEPVLQNTFNEIVKNMRQGATSFFGTAGSPIPFHYTHTLNVLLYCWCLSVGLYLAGMLSIHASLAYAVLVYVFMNLRMIGIKLQNPLGIADEDMDVEANLMRILLFHRNLFNTPFQSVRWDAESAVSGSAIKGATRPDFVGPFVNLHDRDYLANVFMKKACSILMVQQEQKRFGRPGIKASQRMPFKSDQEWWSDVKPAPKEPPKAADAASGSELKPLVPK